MIFLERLVARDFGPLRHVNLEFGPRSRHLISAQPADAGALRHALRLALFGPDGPETPSDGAVELTFSSGGVRYALHREVKSGATRRVALEQLGPGAGLDAHGPGRVQRELERIIGFDRAGFDLAALAAADPGTGRSPAITAIVRQALGERRIAALDATLAPGADDGTVEARAQDAVQLAASARELDSVHAEIESLDASLRRARVARALAALESSETSAGAAADLADQLDGLERQLRVAAEISELRCRAADLGRRRRAAAERADHAGRRAEAAAGELRALAGVEERAEAAAATIKAIDQIEMARAQTQREAEAAARATRVRDEARSAATAMLEARAGLKAAAVRVDKRTAAAARAVTLQERAAESQSLPASRRLWDAWIRVAGAPGESDADELALQRRRAELGQAERDLQALERAGARRQTHTALAGALVLLGAGLIWLSLAGFGPVAAPGVLAVLAGVGLGSWSLRAARLAIATEAALAEALPDLEAQLHRLDASVRKRAQRQAEQARIERELDALGAEVPTSTTRAVTLRDSATTRMRESVDADARPSAEDLADRARAAEAERDAAELDMRRLEARLAELELRDPEATIAAAEADIGRRLQAAAAATDEAERLTATHGLPSDPPGARGQRRTLVRRRDRWMARLARAPDHELDRRRAQHARAEAEAVAGRAGRELDDLRLAHPDLIAADDAVDALRDRQGLLAILAATLAEAGIRRAGVERRTALTTLREAHSTARRRRTDLAAAVRAAGVRLDDVPGAAEIRAIFPDHPNAAQAAADRARLRQVRQQARDLDTKLRRLELRTGAARNDIDLDEARAAHAEIVRLRRVRDTAARIMSAALAEVVGAVPAIAEARLRTIVGPVTLDKYWDVRTGPGGPPAVWDGFESRWRESVDLDAGDRDRLRLAHRLAILAAATPYDAEHVPAFLWLDSELLDMAPADVYTVVEAVAASPLRERWPQLIMTARPGSLAEEVVEVRISVANGSTPPSAADRAARLEATG